MISPSSSGFTLSSGLASASLLRSFFSYRLGLLESRRPARRCAARGLPRPRSSRGVGRSSRFSFAIPTLRSPRAFPLAARSWLPQRIASRVRGAGEHEQIVRQPIHVGQRRRLIGSASASAVIARRSPRCGAAMCSRAAASLPPGRMKLPAARAARSRHRSAARAIRPGQAQSAAPCPMVRNPLRAWRGRRRGRTSRSGYGLDPPPHRAPFAQPSWELASSTAPTASKRGSCLARREPSTSGRAVVAGAV